MLLLPFSSTLIMLGLMSLPLYIIAFSPMSISILTFFPGHGIDSELDLDLHGSPKTCILRNLMHEYMLLWLEIDVQKLKNVRTTSPIYFRTNSPIP